MNDKQLNNFKNRIMELSESQKIEVAELLTEELKYIDRYGDVHDSEHSKRSIQLLVTLISLLKDKEKQKDYEQMLAKFSSLPTNKQVRVLNVAKGEFKKIEAEETKRANEKQCREEGHIFSKWDKRTWTTKEVYWDAGPQGYIDVEHHEWNRTCSRCGFKETVDREPQELIDERKAKAKKEKIKCLEKELNKLKEE